jgi:hypothetical protein
MKTCHPHSEHQGMVIEKTSFTIFEEVSLPSAASTPSVSYPGSFSHSFEIHGKGVELPPSTSPHSNIPQSIGSFSWICCGSRRKASYSCLASPPPAWHFFSLFGDTRYPKPQPKVLQLVDALYNEAHPIEGRFELALLLSS